MSAEPLEALESLRLEEHGRILSSSYKLSHLAQASIALSALTAALVDSLRNSTPVPAVTVPLEQAVDEDLG